MLDVCPRKVVRPPEASGTSAHQCLTHLKPSNIFDQQALRSVPHPYKLRQDLLHEPDEGLGARVLRALRERIEDGVRLARGREEPQVRVEGRELGGGERRDVDL